MHKIQQKKVLAIRRLSTQSLNKAPAVRLDTQSLTLKKKQNLKNSPILLNL